MRRVAFGAAVFALLGSALPALAAPPDRAHVKLAAEEFDAAVTALKQKDFEGAAAHFEAADAAAPSAQALRQAIKARSQASQGSRASTLAALALQRYPSDAATAKLAKDTIETFAPVLGKLNVACASPCVLALDSQTVPGEASTRRTLYVDVGPVTVKATFFGGATVTRVAAATANDTASLRFEPDDGDTPAAPVAAPVASDRDKPAAEKPAAAPTSEEPAQEPSKPTKGLPKGVFITAAAVTVALGAVTIWSGVDTVSNPGTDAVRAACAGKGTNCPLYQTGLGKQTRTNVLIGATAGAAAVTVVLALFTRWKSSPPSESAASLRIEPEATLDDRVRALGVRGAF